MSTRVDQPVPAPLSAQSRSTPADAARLARLGEVVSQILGDLDEPVAATRASLEACVRQIDAQPSTPPEVLRTAVRALANATRADELLRRVRSFVHLDLSPASTVWLNEVVRAAVAQCTAELRSRNIALKLELSESVPALRLDPEILQQAIVSLIFNALEAMADTPADQRELLVRTAVTETAMAEITVRDRGRGLPPELGESIFDPHITTRKGGLGLGLYVSRKIVAAYGGRLWGRSTPPAGSEFRIELPIGPPPATASAPVASPPPRP